MSVRRALLAIHDPGVSDTLQIACARRGYTADVVSSFQEMKARLANELVAYSLIIMDANLDQPGSTDFSPARHVWAIVQEHYHRGALHFRAISGRDEAVAQLRPEGIPVLSKSNYTIADLLPEEREERVERSQWKS